MHLEVAVCLPREAETVALIRTVVTNTLLLFGIDGDCVEDVRLAVSEACTNVIDHAAGDDEYEVRLEVDDDRCVIRITNAGEGFDAVALTGVMPDTSSARGRGVAIMRAVVDSLEFRSEPEAGTVVRLVKRLTVSDDGALARLSRQLDAK